MPAMPNNPSSSDFHDAFDRLPKQVQEAALLKYRDGLDLRQIAERLGVSEAVVERWLTTAEGELKQWFSSNE